MDRLARNLDDLRRIVHTLTGKGMRIEFVKEHLSFTGDDSPMASLLLSVMGAFAEFERALIHERQRKGIALAKQWGAYRGRKKALSVAAVTEHGRMAWQKASGYNKRARAEAAISACVTGHMGSDQRNLLLRGLDRRGKVRRWPTQITSGDSSKEL